jgi:hypothetical protein
VRLQDGRTDSSRLQVLRNVILTDRLVRSLLSLAQRPAHFRDRARGVNLFTQPSDTGHTLKILWDLSSQVTHCPVLSEAAGKIFDMLKRHLYPLAQ